MTPDKILEDVFSKNALKVLEDKGYIPTSKNEFEQLIQKTRALDSKDSEESAKMKKHSKIGCFFDVGGCKGKGCPCVCHKSSSGKGVTNKVKIYEQIKKDDGVRNHLLKMGEFKDVPIKDESPQTENKILEELHNEIKEYSDYEETLKPHINIIQREHLRAIQKTRASCEKEQEQIMDELGNQIANMNKEMVSLESKLEELPEKILEADEQVNNWIEQKTNEKLYSFKKKIDEIERQHKLCYIHRQDGECCGEIILKDLTELKNSLEGSE